MAEKEASSDQLKTENSTRTTGTESSEKRHLLAVLNFGKITQYNYSDGSVEIIRNKFDASEDS